jgi:hypothetical protein
LLARFGRARRRRRTFDELAAQVGGLDDRVDHQLGGEVEDVDLLAVLGAQLAEVAETRVGRNRRQPKRRVGIQAAPSARPAFSPRVRHVDLLRLEPASRVVLGPQPDAHAAYRVQHLTLGRLPGRQHSKLHKPYKLAEFIPEPLPKVML